MKQTSKRLTSIIVALVCIVAALIVLFDLVQPEYGNVVSLKSQLAGEQSLLATEQAAVSNVNQSLKNYANESQAAQSVALAVPNNEDPAGALAQIYGLAQANGIAIQSITVSQPSLPQQSSTSSVANLPLASVSFQINAAGSYEAFQNFISGLQTNVRIFDVKTLSITAAPSVAGSKSGTSQDNFNYNLTVVGYYQAQ